MRVFLLLEGGGEQAGHALFLKALAPFGTECA
jgi:hypothetical protein